MIRRLFLIVIIFLFCEKEDIDLRLRRNLHKNLKMSSNNILPKGEPLKGGDKIFLPSEEKIRGFPLPLCAVLLSDLKEFKRYGLKNVKVEEIIEFYKKYDFDVEMFKNGAMIKRKGENNNNFITIHYGVEGWVYINFFQ